MKKQWLWISFLGSISLFGCEDQIDIKVEEKTNQTIEVIDTEKTSVLESQTETLNLKTMESYRVSYTEKNDERTVGLETNNLILEMNEYYNENQGMYSYVLNVSEEGTVVENFESTLFKILKISVGGNPNKDQGIYKTVTESPLYIDEESIDFSDQSYFIFESKEKLFDDDIYIELIVTNATLYDEDDIFGQTFRLIHLSSPGNSSKTWLTE